MPIEITIPELEDWDEAKREFIIREPKITLKLEHSLVSISKWESKWHKAFLGRAEKTNEEVLDYIKCMTLTQNVNDNVYLRLTADNISDISKYIEDPHTATVIRDDSNSPKSREIPTSELIYYWMITLNIPVEFQKWHLNRLLTLIRVCNFKNSPPKKMSQSDIMERNRALNAARRERLHSKG